MGTYIDICGSFAGRGPENVAASDQDNEEGAASNVRVGLDRCDDGVYGAHVGKAEYWHG